MSLEDMCEIPEEATPAPPETNMFTSTYLNYANQTVTYLVNEGKSHSISRAKVEMDILECVDGPEFPTSFRIAFFSLVLHSDTFDIYWLGQQDLHDLSDASITRLQPDFSLLNQLVPLPAEDAESVSSRDTSPEISLWEARGLPLAGKELYRAQMSKSPVPDLPTPSITISREKTPLDDSSDEEEEVPEEEEEVPLRYRTRSRTPGTRFGSPDSDVSYGAITPTLEEPQMTEDTPDPDEFLDYPTDPAPNAVQPHYGSQGGKTIPPPAAAKKGASKRARGKGSRGGSTRGGTTKATKETATKAGGTRGGSTRGKRGGVRKQVASKTPRKAPAGKGKGKGKSVE